MKEKETKNILSDLEIGYDLIADKFSSTRAFMWRDLGFIKDYTKSTDKILDFGCGNGRLAGFLENDYDKFIGVDISQKLLDIAKQRYSNEKTKFIKIYPVKSRVASASSTQFNRANPLSNKLPFDNGYFDAVFSIAVFHHFPSREYSLKIAQQLHRVLAPGGKIVITVWNLWQKQYLKFHQKSNKDWARADIPFKSGEKIFNRYHHPFEMGELEGLFGETGFKKLKTEEGINLLYIGKKSVLDQ
jgi:tRNA (uracil-5-)-methyltransferase TRM9